MSPEQHPWLSVTDYAHTYGVERKTVYKWLESGLLVVYRVGRLIRVRNQPPVVQKSQNYAFRKQ